MTWFSADRTSARRIFSLRGGRAKAEWAFALGVAYLVFWVPERRREEEARVAEAERRNRGLVDVDRVAPRGGDSQGWTSDPRGPTRRGE